MSVSIADVALAESGPKVVSTANLAVEVENVIEAAEEARLATEAEGGALFAESSSFRDELRSVLTLKVPPEGFRPLLNRLGELGSATSQEITTDDVTERAVDLESRIRTTEASVTRLRDFLEGVGSVEEVARLEGELLARETELETLVGQLRALENRVDFATVVLTLVEVHEVETVDEPRAEDEAAALPGFFDGLRGGWDAFISFGSVALAVVGAVIPWVPVLLAALLAWRLVRRFGGPAGVESSRA